MGTTNSVEIVADRYKNMEKTLLSIAAEPLQAKIILALRAGYPMPVGSKGTLTLWFLLPETSKSILLSPADLRACMIRPCS